LVRFSRGTSNGDPHEATDTNTRAGVSPAQGKVRAQEMGRRDLAIIEAIHRAAASGRREDVKARGAS